MENWQQQAVEEGVTNTAEYETLAVNVHGFGGGEFVEVSQMRLRFSEMDAELESQEKWWRDAHMPIESVPVTNDGAHEDLQFLLDNGAPLWAALQYIELHTPDEERAGDPYLGATLAEIMHREIDVKGGSSKGRCRSSQLRGPSLEDRNRRFDQQMMEDRLQRKGAA